MNIAFCLESTFNSGGMERMLSVIANAIGYSETVMVITAFNEGRTDYFAFNDCVRRIDLGIRREAYGKRGLKRQYRHLLERCLIDNPQDVTISLGSLEYIFLPTLKDGSKKVLWFHFALNYDMMTCHVSRFRAVNRLVGTLKTYRRLWLAKKYDHVVCLSKEDLKRWRRHMSNVSQIYNPNTITKSNEPDYTAKRVIAVGRLDPQKGFDVLISAWKRVASYILIGRLTFMVRVIRASRYNDKSMNCRLATESFYAEGPMTCLKNLPAIPLWCYHRGMRASSWCCVKLLFVPFPRCHLVARAGLLKSSATARVESLSVRWVMRKKWQTL